MKESHKEVSIQTNKWKTNLGPRYLFKPQNLPWKDQNKDKQGIVDLEFGSLFMKMPPLSMSPEHVVKVVFTAVGIDLFCS